MNSRRSRRRRRCRSNRCGRKKRLIALLALAAVISAGISFAVHRTIEPNLEEISRIRAEVVISRTVNKALTELFREEKTHEDLFVVKTGEDGRVDMVQANSIEINILMSQLSINLQEAFKNMDNEYIEVPIGSLLGSKLLSQVRPSISLAIVPLSVSSMDFRTEFEAQGINQTKYKIYIVLSCKVKVIAPFSSKTFKTSSKVLIAETVILGDVPDSFVQVPEEDILDVT